MAVRPNKKKWKENFVASLPIAVPEMTAAKRAKTDEFISACADKGVEPTKRQAAKYNAGRNHWSGR